MFLPIGIETYGEKEIEIQDINNNYSKKKIRIEISKRDIKQIVLKHSDEKMRDTQPMIKKQHEIVLSSLKVRTEERFWKEGFIEPIEASISTPFALYRKGKNYSYYHKGVDYSAKKGTPVKAINDGRVILNMKDFNVYGNTLIIDHGHGVVSCYFHLKKTFKDLGDKVSKGGVIGEVGSTGWASGPHLHLGIYLQGEAVDPLWWIRFSNDFFKN